MKNSAIKHDEIYQYDPLTENQKKAFDAWADGDHLALVGTAGTCLLYTSPSPRDGLLSRMPSSA